ncbi:MAG: hypothetical protein Q7T87_13705 [Polaromonas sp.]|nr:hypothetical protein [Polaromonas sp.]
MASAAPHTFLRQPTLLDLTKEPPPDGTGARRWVGRAQNFAVEWFHASDARTHAEMASDDELLLIVLNAPVGIAGNEHEMLAQPRSICILPPGDWQIHLEPGATCAAVKSLRAAAQAGAINEDRYAQPDARIAPVGDAWARLCEAKTPAIFSIDAIAAPRDKPRLKMLQTATLSINWVEYEGPRNRQALSPHSHSHFEQGSLALDGDFVHHLRTPWGPDADVWEEDRHELLGSPSLMVVPVETIHTTEGVGAGHHLLIDIFSPPRADFIAKGWVANAGDYAAPDQGAA